MQKRSLTLMKKVDSNIESILTQFLKIIELSSILDKSQGTLSVESLQIESNSSTIVRMIEELLSITRNLKESWILGQIPSVETNEESYLQNLDVKMNKLLNLILEEDEDDEIVTYGEEKDEAKAEVDEQEVANTNVAVNDVKDENSVKNEEPKEADAVVVVVPLEVAKVENSGDEPPHVKTEKAEEKTPPGNEDIDMMTQSNKAEGEVINDDDDAKEDDDVKMSL